MRVLGPGLGKAGGVGLGGLAELRRKSEKSRVAGGNWTWCWTWEIFTKTAFRGLAEGPFFRVSSTCMSGNT